jgi:hypothetical protein
MQARASLKMTVTLGGIVAGPCRHRWRMAGPLSKSGCSEKMNQFAVLLPFQ